MEEQEWVIVRGPYQARKFPGNVLNPARWARRRLACRPEHRLASIHSFPLSYCLQPGEGRIQDPLDPVFFLVAVPVSVSGRAEHGSIEFGEKGCSETVGLKLFPLCD